jgi:signal transduction histidine kinase
MNDSYVRTEFLELLAHDLRGPAATGTGALDELEHASLTDDGQKLVAIARRSFRRILRITQLLVETAELERGDLTLSRARYSLAELVQPAVEDARSLENRRGLELDVALPDPLYVHVDRTRIVRVIFEVVSSAIRAAKTKVRVSASSSDGVVLSILDDGGVAPVLSTRFAADADCRRANLGLAMAVDVVAAHGGSVELGRDGEMTRIAIRLPHA